MTGPDSAGWLCFRRKFGAPGRIDAHERVWLTIANAKAKARVMLNGRYLGGLDPLSPFERNVTDQLQRRNELTIEVETAGENENMPGDVALEVRCTAYLRNVRCWLDDERRLRASVEVVGTCESQLELYVLVDNRTLIYLPVASGPDGRIIHLLSEDAVQGTGAVRVELVNGASVWHTWEGTV